MRALVLAAAVACLGLTMCHSEKKAATPPPANTQAAQPPADPPAQKPTYFPATKAAAPIR